VSPSGDEFEVIGTFIPGAAWTSERVVLLVRVAEMDQPVPAYGQFDSIQTGPAGGTNAFGQSLVVKVVSLSLGERGKWICLVEPLADLVFIAESEFSELLPDRPGAS
jgi:hypothetical protein